jgi:EpsI family protein
LRIGDWTGREALLDEALIEAADVQDYVSRGYVRPGSPEPVALFVAFGVQARDLEPHRPDVCYPAAGWTLRGKREKEIELAGGETLRTIVYLFGPGGLDPRKLVVLNYYVVDGETSEDVSLLRWKASRGQTGIRYMAQVQITSRIDPAWPEDSADSTVASFAQQVALPIRDLIERSVRDPGELDAGSASAPQGETR